MNDEVWSAKSAFFGASIGDAFFRALIEQTQELVSVLDADGRYLYVSPSHRVVLGYEASSLLGQDAFALVHPDDRSDLLARFRHALAQPGRTESREYRHRHADGSWHVLTATGTNLIADPSVRGLVVSARDVTEYHRTAGMLAEHRRMLAERLAELDLLYQSAPVGLALIDCDLRYVRVNDTMAGINGCAPAAHVGRRVREVLPDIADFLEPVLREVIETGQPVAGRELRGGPPADPDSIRDWLVSYHRLSDAAGRALGVNAVVLDITARKQVERERERARRDLEERVRERTLELENANAALRAEIAERQRVEESLRRSEARFRYLVENVSEVIFVLDRAGCLTYVSPAVEALLGYRPAEIVGQPCLDLVEPEDRARILASFRLSLDGIARPIEGRVRGKDGRVRWVRSHGGPLIEEGQTVGVQGVAIDITQRRLDESERRRRQTELAHAQRLTTAGEMTAEIAHQMNQPLAAIANFASGLATRLDRVGGDAASLSEVARRIAREALRAGEIIRQLRAFLRKGEGSLRRCDPNELVAQVFRLIEEDFRRAAIDVHLDLAPAVPALDLNPVLIEQVVLNLLRNALEAMVAAEPGAHHLDVATRAAGGEVMVTVRDTGVGLPPGAEGRVFEAFLTTKPEGLGLGLSVSRSIIEASGGRLWVEPHAGRGTVAGFALPLRG